MRNLKRAERLEGARQAFNEPEIKFLEAVGYGFHILRYEYNLAMRDYYQRKGQKIAKRVSDQQKIFNFRMELQAKE